MRYWLDEFKGALQRAVDDVIARLRTCPHCGEVFLRRHKQEYCSPRCQMIAKTRRYRVRHKVSA